MSPPQACYIPRDLLLWVRFRGLGQTGNRTDGRVQLSGRVVLSMPEVLGSILSPSINSKKTKTGNKAAATQNHGMNGSCAPVSTPAPPQQQQQAWI